MQNYGLVLSTSPHTDKGLLFNDLIVLFRALHAVGNNAIGSVGGGGKPLVAPPPKLCAPPATSASVIKGHTST